MSGLYIRIAIDGRLHWLWRNLHRLRARLTAIDVIARQICFGICSPDQIDEGFLPRTGEDSLQTRWRCGRKYVVRKHHDLGSVLAFELLLFASRTCNVSDYGGAVDVCLFPL